MKQAILGIGLGAFLCLSSYASDSIPTPSSPTIPTPTPGPKLPTPDSPPKPETGAVEPETQGAASSAPLSPPSINCNYHIPAETTKIEQTIVLQWAKKAAQQSFELDHKNVEQQLANLKACYTDQGWQGFNDALQKSGNLNAIKTQQLVVNSNISGETKINEVKDNQWKVSLPMQVIYQNGQDKLTQALTVNVVVGRKMSGDLGIMQLIAMPQQANLPMTKQNEEQTKPTASPLTPAK